MAVVSLFWNTNIAAVTSCECALYLKDLFRIYNSIQNYRHAIRAKRMDDPEMKGIQFSGIWILD